MELASISRLEREQQRQYLIYVSVTVNVQKYLCIDLQLTIWMKSDAPECRMFLSPYNFLQSRLNQKRWVTCLCIHY